MNYITKNEQGNWRVQSLTRPPEKPYHIAPPGITQENVSIVDIINSKPVINQTRKTAFDADKVAGHATTTAEKTKVVARQSSLQSGYDNFSTLTRAAKDKLLKDLLAAQLGM